MAVLNGYVEGAVRDEVSWAEEVRRSGLSESEWVARSYPYVQQLLKRGEYPIFTKIAMEARQPHLSRDDQFRYGLERVLDCVAASLPSPARRPRPGPAR
ncbi:MULTISPECIES: TetR/AcrR family transcriptional regulator C-terminal domain-containing protein [Kitasatospora]|uniref:Tetracycline repressor TetR C-terminal domain-containing protein n=1 Tax=Kitasatospora cystarginea TaxID=58350 RepID=A0ABN3EZD6_9ACTN